MYYVLESVVISLEINKVNKCAQGPGIKDVGRISLVQHTVGTAAASADWTGIVQIIFFRLVFVRLWLQIAQAIRIDTGTVALIVQTVRSHIVKTCFSHSQRVYCQLNCITYIGHDVCTKCGVRLL